MGYDFTVESIEITQCWLNIYNFGMSPEVHHQPNNIMTGVYHLEAQANCSEVLFHSHFADLLIRPAVYEDNELNNPIASLHSEPGDLIFLVHFDTQFQQTTKKESTLVFRLMRGSKQKMYELPSTILEYFPQTILISKPSNFKKLNSK